MSILLVIFDLVGIQTMQNTPVAMLLSFISLASLFFEDFTQQDRSRMRVPFPLGRDDGVAFLGYGVSTLHTYVVVSGAGIWISTNGITNDCTIFYFDRFGS
jgi:hypothetical protein